MEDTKVLYQEYLNGDKQAFDKIMDLYMENLIYFIQRYVGKLDVAQDLAQDVFVYILLNPNKYNSDYSLKTYLYTIGKSKALNYIKKEKKMLFLNEEIIYDVDEDLEEIIFRNEKIQCLKSDINRLSKSYQVAIYLADIEELSYGEICQILNKTIPQVKMVVHRARKKLKLILEKEHKKYDK